MEKTNNILIGKWQIVCWKVITENGWENLKGYPSKKYIWEFLPDGKLVEVFDPDSSSSTTYCFYPDELLLAIDRSDYADDGYMLACIEEHYRVEILSDRYIVLYDLEDVVVEPDDYTFKIELEKL